MVNYFEQKGMLKVVLGKGFISAYELNKLTKGDIAIVTDRLCGEHAGLYFNNQLLGLGDIVISQGRIGFRIIDTGWSPSEVPFPGVVEEVTEILETEFVVCERTCSLEELKGIGKYSVIDFGSQEGNTRRITLYAAGIAAASGITIVLGENWGIRIDDAKKLGAIDLAVRTTQPPLSEEKVKDYDYTRPDRFSMEQFKTVNMIHERLIQNLHLLKTIDNLLCCSIDQLTWGEWCQYNKEHNVIHQNIVIAGSTREMRGQSRSTSRIFFLPSRDLLDDGFITRKTAMYKAQYEANENALPFQSILVAFQGEKAASLIKESRGIVLFLSQLESSWREKLVAEFSLISNTEQIPEDFIDEYEMIMLVTIEVSDSGKDYIQFVYPYLYLQKVLHLLS